MLVNLEIKGQLAKLLATEDLIIENKKVETAMFNVDTRVLTLPMWERASNQVYDMLVAHEVGHAIFTPNEDPKVEVPMQFINVTEDARIEKMMKRKYGGITKTFYRGYKELHDEDFFSVKDENISELNLADRANLWFKIGSLFDIPIQEGEEKEIIDMIASAETFDQSQEAAVALYNYCKKELDQSKKEEKQDVKPNSNGSGSSPSEEEQQQSNSDAEDQSKFNEQEVSSGSSSGSTNVEDSHETNSDEEPKVKTDENLVSKLKDLTSTSLGNEYVESPDLNLDTIINANKELQDYIKDHFSVYVGNEFEHVDNAYSKFKKESQKEVNYLVKEFECRKSADAYSRSFVSKTGVLDTSKLHTYKFNEDLFKKVNIIPDGKNHGLIFILDWSGSMTEVLMDTIKQLYNLIWFCKKCSIPFSVYAFTLEYNTVTYDNNGHPVRLQPHYQKKSGLFAVDERFSLMEFFSSEVSGKDLDLHMKNIWRCAFSIRHYAEYTPPPRLSLSGTPLNETILSLRKIIPLFKAKHKLQKVQCVILTDGEANHLNRHKMVKRNWEAFEIMGCVSLGYNTYYRNRKTGSVKRIPTEWYNFTNMLLEDLKEEFPQVNLIGIRIIDRDVSTFIRRYCGWYSDEFDASMRQWKKNKSISIKVSGYDRYFGMSKNVLAQNTDFEVKDDATKTQIKSAFVKSLRSKKLNKKILGEFVELIA